MGLITVTVTDYDFYDIGGGIGGKLATCLNRKA
jgi:hypothetical protein